MDKARFMEKYCSQVEGNDLLETYSPTARVSTMRFGMKPRYGIKSRQLDIRAECRKKSIQEEIYMEQSERFVLLYKVGKKLLQA